MYPWLPLKVLVPCQATEYSSTCPRICAKVKNYIPKVAKRAWRVIGRNHLSIGKMFLSGMLPSRNNSRTIGSLTVVLVGVRFWSRWGSRWCPRFYAITVDCCTESAAAYGNSFFKGRPAARLLKPHVAASMESRKDTPCIYQQEELEVSILPCESIPCWIPGLLLDRISATYLGREGCHRKITEHV